MRMSLRLILSLVMTVTLISVLFALYQVRAYTHGRQGDLEKRAQVLAESLQETVEPLWTKGARGSLRRIVERFGNRERLDGVAIYDAQGRPNFVTPSLATRLGDRASSVRSERLRRPWVESLFRLWQERGSSLCRPDPCRGSRSRCAGSLP